MRYVICLLIIVILAACGGESTSRAVLPAATAVPASPRDPTAAPTPTPGATGVERSNGTATPELDSIVETPTRIVTPTVALTPIPSPPSSDTPTVSPKEMPQATIPVNTPDTPTVSPEETPQATIAINTPEKISGPVVNVGGAAFLVELALTPGEKVQGLSNRPSLAPSTGMLFIYEHQSRYNFWMKDMRFPLDFLWIGADCTVVDTTLDVPPPLPEQTLDQLPRYTPELPAQYVLEINAGEVAANSIDSGDLVKFAGDLAGRYGC